MSAGRLGALRRLHWSRAGAASRAEPALRLLQAGCPAPAPARSPRRRLHQQQATGGTSEIIQSSKKVLASLKKKHPMLKPTLAILQAGSYDLVQEMNKNLAEEIGLYIIHIWLPEDSSEDEIVGEILKLNDDPTVHGLALHLPENAYSSKILSALKPEKDVDGVSAVNLGQLLYGDVYDCLPYPTASAVIQLLENIDRTIDGKKVLLVGTAAPLAASLQCLLQRKGAMVMSCQWNTQQLQSKVFPNEKDLPRRMQDST